MSRPLRLAMSYALTIPRGGVVHAMCLSEALDEIGVKTTLHRALCNFRGFFASPCLRDDRLPVKPAPRETADMVEQRIGDYLRWFRRPENRHFDLYHAHDGIGANALATLKERADPRLLRTVHHTTISPTPGSCGGRRGRSCSGRLHGRERALARDLMARFGREPWSAATA